MNKAITLLCALIAGCLISCDSGDRGGRGNPKNEPPGSDDKSTIPAPPPLPQPTFLEVTSTPPGASLEIGLRDINTPGSGRQVGTTPVRVELHPSDIDSRGNIIGELRYPRHSDHTFLIHVGPELQPGRTHTGDYALTPWP